MAGERPPHFQGRLGMARLEKGDVMTARGARERCHRRNWRVRGVVFKGRLVIGGPVYSFTWYSLLASIQQLYLTNHPEHLQNVRQQQPAATAAAPGLSAWPHWQSLPIRQGRSRGTCPSSLPCCLLLTYLQATVGVLTGSQAWKASGEQDKAAGLAALKKVGEMREQQDPNHEHGYGRAEEIAGRVTGCQGMEREGHASAHKKQ